MIIILVALVSKKGKKKDKNKNIVTNEIPKEKEKLDKNTIIEK